MNLDLTALQQYAGAAVLIGAAGVAAWKSWRADKQTRGTGNGFADEMRTRLGRIEKKQDRIEEKIDNHIDAHADAEINRR